MAIFKLCRISIATVYQADRRGVVVQVTPQAKLLQQRPFIHSSASRQSDPAPVQSEAIINSSQEIWESGPELHIDAIVALQALRDNSQIRQIWRD